MPHIALRDTPGSGFCSRPGKKAATHERKSYPPTKFQPFPGTGVRLGALFSHSRLSSFENCRKQFEFRYIQKIPSETESVEAFVGKRVHEILERLYLFVGRGQIPGIEKVVDRYQKLWDESYDADRVRIVREATPLAYYRKLGESCIRGYYVRHYPFDDGETLGIEKRVVFPLDEAGDYKIQGVIDRISRARDGCIEIHDYKTGHRVPAQRVLDQDRQLALYQIGLSSQFGEDQRFRLVWHYVAKNRTRTSTRTPDELRQLRESTIARIDEIRSTTVFAPKKIALCPWCEYQSRCPLFSTEEVSTEEVPTQAATEAVSASAAPPPTADAAPTPAAPGATTPSSKAISPSAKQTPAQPAGEQLDLL